MLQVPRQADYDYSTPWQARKPAKIGVYMYTHEFTDIRTRLEPFT